MALALGVALILLANAVVLLGVWRNRAGEPTSIVELTGRELGRWWHRNRDEDTGLNMPLSWNHDESIREWFDAAKLGELGFAIDFPLGERGAGHFYRRHLSRGAFVVLELGGEAWRRRLERQREKLEDIAREIEGRRGGGPSLEEHRETYEKINRYASRLTPVDVGPDPRALRRAYPDASRFLIARAKVGIVHSNLRGEEPHLLGRIESLGNKRIHVPLEWRGVIDPLIEARIDADEDRRRFKARIAWGRRFEPWLVSVEPLSDAPEAVDELLLDSPSVPESPGLPATAAADLPGDPSD